MCSREALSAIAEKQQRQPAGSLISTQRPIHNGAVTSDTNYRTNDTSGCHPPVHGMCRYAKRAFFLIRCYECPLSEKPRSVSHKPVIRCTNAKGARK